MKILRIKFIFMCLILILLNKKIYADSINTQSSQQQKQSQQHQKTNISLHHSISSDLSDLPTRFGDEDDVIVNNGDIIKITPNKQKTEINSNTNNNNNSNNNNNNKNYSNSNSKNNKFNSHRDHEDDDEDDRRLEIPLSPRLNSHNLNHDHLDLEDNYDDDFDEDLDHHYPDKSDPDSDYKHVIYDDDNESDELFNNFGKNLNVGKTDLPIFLKDPISTYVVRNKPATLNCKAAHALQLVFKCSGSSHPPPSNLESHVDPHSGVRFQEVTATISRDLVDEYFGKGPFKCECHALSPRGKVRSNPATVEVAYIKKQFNIPPTSQRVELGQRAEIRCSPPNGAPSPKITWLKDGVPINSDPAVLVTAEGNILVSHATLQEMSNYTCVAENIAGKRVSEPAILTVYVDGGWSAWGPWSECRCPGRPPQGQRRLRTCSNPTPLHGGAPCGGPNVQKTPDCLTCPGGRWSTWSDWSVCNSECVQTRRRSCISFDSNSPIVGARLSSDSIDRSGNSNGGSCNGRDYQTTECTGGLCKIGKQGSDWALYVLLGIVAVLCVIIGAAFACGAKRSRRLPPYSMTRAEMQPEYFHDPDKKTIQFQPDLTQGVGGVNYEYPHHRYGGGSIKIGNGINSNIGTGNLIQNAPIPLPRSVSEHHYDVPHLTANYSTPLDRVSGNESYTSSNYSKRIHSTESLATTTNTSDSTYDVATEPPTLPISHKNYLKLNTSRQIITSNGGCLKLDHLSVALSIPDGALNKNSKHNIFLSVLNEDNMRLKLNEKLTHLSPIVNTGPAEINLNKSVIIKLPHCAEELNQWQISLYHTTSHIQDPEPKWQKIVSLGEETINTPIYVQLDDNNAYIMSEFLGRYVLIGESLENGIGAIKKMKLCLFGPSTTPINDCNIRVYVVEDVPSAIEHCAMLEKRLGGILLTQSPTLSFQDNGHDLNLDINCVGGWKSKPGTENQKIPFSHVWNNSLSLHCAFALERTEQEMPGLRLEINARQRQGGEVTAIHVAPFLQSERAITLNTIDEYNENSGGSGRSVTVSDKGVTSISDSEVVFRLTKQSRKELCTCLDPPTARGNDWRMLAQKLGVDRYIVYFATKQSPTEHILDLWECRNRESSALNDLVIILRSMGRSDAVTILEKSIGPSWL